MARLARESDSASVGARHSAAAGDGRSDSAETAREEALARQAASGDEEAFEDLVRLVSPRVYRILWTMLRGRDEVEEVMQEVFLQVYRSIARFRGESRFSTWLYRVAINTAKMHIRAATREKVVPRDAMVPIDDEGHMRPIPDWSRLPEKRLLAKELRETLQRAVHALPESYRSVYALAEVEGLPYAEVAKSLKLTVQTVKIRLHRARLTLRSALELYLESAR